MVKDTLVAKKKQFAKQYGKSIDKADVFFKLVFLLDVANTYTRNPSFKIKKMRLFCKNHRFWKKKKEFNLNVHIFYITPHPRVHSHLPLLPSIYDVYPIVQTSKQPSFEQKDFARSLATSATTHH